MTTKEILLKIAIDLAERIGYDNITKIEIARIAQVHHSLINRYFGTVEFLKNLVIQAATEEENLQIIAQGLSINDQRFVKIPDKLKIKAAKYIVHS